MSIDTGDVGVFAIVPEHVGHVMAPLEHVAAAGQIVRPIARIRRPGVVAVEPLAEHHQSQARLVGVGRLVGAFVDHEAGDAAVHRDVGHILEAAGIVAPGVAGQSGGGEGFGRGDVLSIDVGHGSGLADVGLGHRQGGTAAGARNPEGAHRHGGRHLEVHAVAHIDAAVLVGFRIAALHAVLLGDQVDAVVIGGEHLADGLAPVEQELLALFGAFHNLPRQDRQPRDEVVAAGGLEGRGQRLGPGHLLRLVTVSEDVLDAVLAHQAAGRLLVHVHVGAEIVHPGLFIQLVHFQAGGLRRRRMVLLAGKGSAEAIDAPVPGGNLPGHDAVLHKGSQVDGFEHRSVGSRGGIVREVVRGGKAGLLLRVVHAGDRVQDEFMDGCSRRSHTPVTESRVGHVRDRIRHTQAEIPRLRDGDVNGLLGDGTGRDAADIGPYHTVFAALEDVSIGRSLGGPLATGRASHEGERLHRNRLRE